MRTFEIQIESFKPDEARGKFKEVRKIQARNIEEATKIANEITYEILEKSAIAWEYRWEFVGVEQGHYITDWNKAFASMKEKITEELLRQYRTVQMSGVTNMFDRNAVQYYAFQVGMYELVNFIDEYGRQGYTELLKVYDENVEPYEGKVLKLRNEYL